MPEMRSAVVAGSKGFVDAVQGHIKMRLGAAPRVARDPGEALRACSETGGLLVLEYAGTPWLDAVKNLRSACGDAVLSIVAAVPAEQASEVQSLQRAGVDEVVSWQGRADPVIWAVDRVVDRRSAQAAPTLPLPEAAAEGGTGLGVREISSADPRATQEPRPPVPSSLPGPAPVLPRPAGNPPRVISPAPWPDAVPSSPAAEAMLLAASAGHQQDEEAAGLSAAGVLASASELERAAFAGVDVPVDPAVLRAAAAMRLRLELALASVPVGGVGMNQGSAQQLLAEVDGVLEQLRALAASAPAGIAPSLEPARLAIVDSGVKLANAVSRLAPAVTAVTVPPLTARAKPAATRLLSDDREEPTRRKRPAALWVAFAISCGIAAAYHGRTILQHPDAPRASIPGAPANTVGRVRGGVPTFSALPGKTIDKTELERFAAAEKAKGNVLKEVAPGTYIVLPDAPEPSRGGQ